MFSKLFKPKWQHSDPQIRLVALQQLNPIDPAAFDIISTLTSDADANVRLAAINKMPPTFEALDRLAAIETDHTILTRLRARHLDLMLQSPPDATLARINNETDGALLETLLKKSPHRAVREYILTLITKESMLEYVVIHDPDNDIKNIAIQMIASLQPFERIIKHFRSRNKEITRLAKERIKVLEDEIARPIETERQARQICIQLEGTAADGYSDRLETEFKLAKELWLALETTPPAELSERYQAITLIIDDLLAQHALEEAERQRIEQQYAAVKVEKTRVLAEANELLAQVQSQPNWYESYPLAELEAAWETLTIAWVASGDLPTRDGATLTAEWKRVEQAITQAQRTLVNYPKTLSYIERTKQQLDKMLTSYGVIPENKRKDLHRRVAAIQLPDAVDRFELIGFLYDQLKQLDELAEARLKKSKLIIAELPELMVELGELLHQNDLAASQTLSRRIRKKIDFLPEKNNLSLRSEFKRHLARINELEDWRGFATQPKREELCLRMEKLITDEIDPELRAKAIQSLQEDWKALGGGDPREVQALWERFHKAAEEAYLPCKAFYDERARVRREHLAQREAICDQLEEQLAWLENNTPDWVLLERFIQTAYNEWRQCGTIERRQMNKVGKRFHNAVNALRAVMQTYYKANREKKEQLISRLKETVNTSDPQEAANAAKKTQQEWRLIGSAGYKSEQALWGAFRKVCDQIFERLSQAFHERKAQNEQTYNTRRTLLDQLEQALNAADCTKASIELALETFYNAWDSLWGTAEGQDKLDPRNPLISRLQKATALAEQILKQLDTAAESNRITVDDRKASLCSEYETLLLTAGTLTLEQVESFKTAWEAAGTGTKEVAELLEPRYQRLLGAAEISAQELSELAKQGEAQLATLESICLDMEILADVPSPKEPGIEEKRMRRKVLRLEDRLRRGTQHDQDERRDLEAQWYAASMVPAKAAQALNARFTRARAALLGG